MGQVIKKPWMANLATDPVLDYLLRGHDDPALWRAVEKTGEFVMRSFLRGKRRDYWPYEVSYADGNYDPWIHLREPESRGKLPTRWQFAHGHKARLLNVLSRRRAQPRYFGTWLRFYKKHWANAAPSKGDYHVFDKTLQHLPFAQAHRWNARWKNGALHIDPIPCAELRGAIITPAGRIALTIRRERQRYRIVDRVGASIPVKIGVR